MLKVSLVKAVNVLVPHSPQIFIFLIMSFFLELNNDVLGYFGQLDISDPIILTSAVVHTLPNAV
jgi:hypothetical protein